MGKATIRQGSQWKKDGPVADGDMILFALGRAAAFFKGARGTLIRSLIAEAQADPELAEAFRDCWLSPRREGVRQTMRRAIKEGALRADTNVDVAIDLLYGALYYRLLLGSGPLDARFVEDAFGQFLKRTRLFKTMNAWNGDAGR